MKMLQFNKDVPTLLPAEDVVVQSDTLAVDAVQNTLLSAGLAVGLYKQSEDKNKSINTERIQLYIQLSNRFLNEKITSL